MRITVICVGKIKEKFYTDALAEYRKRLSKYCKLEIVELADEKTKDIAKKLIKQEESGFFLQSKKICMSLHLQLKGRCWIPLNFLKK